MTLGHGSQLGPYEILVPIGAGGMGEVYKAKDTRLDRTVAIKVLPEHLSNDLALRERFEREARAVSSLNHPHICTLHDVGEHEGIHFLVMEYIEGETLADRLKKGPLHLTQALEYAAQIASALDKAHRNGIVHRDLKPGNIMITKSGVKLLDFGLAKASPPRRSLGEGGPDAPTQQKPLTDAGTILGTVQYMAPEQLEGKDVDARADLFALGAVLFEMLTGDKAFQGESQASLISAIMSTQPPAVSPPALDRVIKRCLAKDPEDRWHSAHDLEAELRWIASSDSNVRSVAAHSSMSSRFAIAALALVALALGATTLMRDNGAEDSHSYHLSIDLPEDVELTGGDFSVAISPNGSTLVYRASKNGVAQLWRRELAGFEASPIPGTDGARRAFFSPDGAWLGFFTEDALRKFNLEHGATQVVTTPLSVSSPTGSWGSDGYIYFSTDVRAGLARVSADGGDVEHLTAPDYQHEEIGHIHPVLLPDQKNVLFTVISGSGGRGAVLSLATGTWARFDQLGVLRGAEYLSSGHLLYVAEDSATLMVVAFDLDRLEPVGAASVLERDVVVMRTAGKHFGVSEHGTLAFVPDSGLEPSLVWVNRTGEVLGTVDRASSHPSVSPADGRVAVDGQFSESLDIWIFDERGTERRLTNGGTNDFPIWSPDGRLIVFSSTGQTLPQLSLRRADGLRTADVLWQSEVVSRPTSWSSDGRFLALELTSEETARDIWVLPLEQTPDGAGFRAASEPNRIHATPVTEGGAVFSPDGRWLAYVSTETGRAEVYVEGFPTPDERIVVSSGGGVEPEWSRDGAVLFFRVGESFLSARIMTKPALHADPPQVLFDTTMGASNTHSHYAVTDNGFVMRSERVPLDRQRINIVTNLFERIEALSADP